MQNTREGSYRYSIYRQMQQSERVQKYELSSHSTLRMQVVQVNHDTCCPSFLHAACHPTCSLVRRPPCPPVPYPWRDVLRGFTLQARNANSEVGVENFPKLTKERKVCEYYVLWEG